MKGIFGLAFEGLLRKKGRNLLTMSGVLIGVFALTMIVSLGEGLAHAVTDTVSGQDNLRQVGVTGGFGIELSNDPFQVAIEGEMPEARRERLRRSAVNRRQIRQWYGRRVTQITDDTMGELAKLPHVEAVSPVIVERYEIQVAEFETGPKLSFGVDVAQGRYDNRIIAGRYFSEANAGEVILHEYLLYQWGLITEADYSQVLGKTIRLKSIVNTEQPEAPVQMAGFLENLTPEEREAAMKLLPKLMGMAQQTRKPVEREFKVVGVMRETQQGDELNIIEDGQSVQADLFLPLETSRAMFEDSAVNQQLGYPAAVVMVDSPDNAPEVEQAVRDKGFTAFSVASVLKQVETMLTVITVIIAFLTGIALIVSTLGIVNTMITSVLERTREIGIFKAVGATNGQVMGVFLTESALIGLVGGLMGLGLAALLMIPGDAIGGAIIAERASIPYAGSVFVLPLWLAIAGPAIGAVTAVLAAIIPARRAARIDPVKALRHD